MLKENKLERLHHIKYLKARSWVRMYDPHAVFIKQGRGLKYTRNLLSTLAKSVCYITILVSFKRSVFESKARVGIHEDSYELKW